MCVCWGVGGAFGMAMGCSSGTTFNYFLTIFFFFEGRVGRMGGRKGEELARDE